VGDERDAICYGAPQAFDDAFGGFAKQRLELGELFSIGLKSGL
jgi:hypothetical protein